MTECGECKGFPVCDSDCDKGSALAAKHYQQVGEQPIEIMQNKMTHEQFVGFLRGNVIKYACRMGYKDEPLKDAQKAAQYAKWLCMAVDGKKINPMEGAK